MRVAFLGTPAYALPCLEALLTAGHQVVGVYCPPDRPVGRGRRREPPPVKRYAQGRGLPVYQPRSLREPQAQGELASLRPEALVVAAYGRLLPREVLDIPPLGCVNVHPSTLPRHRGPSPVVTALLEGDTVTGVTIMLLDEGMDTGPILAQREERVGEGDTAVGLTERLFRLGAALLVEVLPRWARGELRPQPQDEGQATYTRRVTKEDGRVDWRMSAEGIARMIRAYQPWPGAHTFWRGRLLKIHQAVALLGGGPVKEPGLVVSLEEHLGGVVAVVTGEGLLVLRRVQMEGKQLMGAAEFLRGYRGFVGSHLPS